MASIEVGELNPELITQERSKECMSAELLAFSRRFPELDGLTQRDFTDTLEYRGLFLPKDGVPPQPAELLDISLAPLGINVFGVYAVGWEANSTAESPEVQQRLAAIDAVLEDEDGKGLLLAYPKFIPGNKLAYLHYVMPTGYEEVDGQRIRTVMDADNTQGGVFHCSEEEFLKYVTPIDDAPVFAYGLQRGNGKPLVRPTIQPAKKPGDTLLTDPLWKTESLGVPVPPDSPDAISVCMPTVESVEVYNLIGGAALSVQGDALPFAYPRFGLAPDVVRLSGKVMGRFNSMPYPTQAAANEAGRLAMDYGDPEKAQVTYRDGLFWLEDSGFNAKAWQHAGLGISSRRARAVLEGQPDNDTHLRDLAEAGIKDVIERYTGAEPEDIYLFETGMAAIRCITQLMNDLADGAPPIQFGFPYTDTFQQQRLFGESNDIYENVDDVRRGNYDELMELIAQGAPASCLMTEFPSNPLLAVPDMQRLDAITRGLPIILDDTIGTMFNIDDELLPDSVAVRVTSLTKFFSSAGDVMGGSLVLRRNSPYYERIKTALEAHYQDNLWHSDAAALLANSADFPRIMPIINTNAERLARWLDDEFRGPDKPLKYVFHPSLTDPVGYNQIKSKPGGFGGVMSWEFNDAAVARDSYRRLRITKGPSLGTKYSLVCPYTLLAHKDELDGAARFGAVKGLIRISVGIEPFDDLQDRTAEVLQV